PEALDGCGNVVAISDHVEPTFRREFLAALGDEGGQFRYDFAAEVDDAGIHRQFEVETGLDRLLQEADISIRDVASILTEMENDAGGAGGLAYCGCMHRIRNRLLPGITKGCDVIDVDKES